MKACRLGLLVLAIACQAHATDPTGGAGGDPAKAIRSVPLREEFNARKYLGNAGAEVLSEAELMPALAAALDQLSKYPRLVGTPEVRRVPHERIEELVCRSKCAARAVYRPGEGIYLDDKLHPETNLFDRSILLHELVHYAQDMGGEHGDMKPCQRWYFREQEAYAIQKIFLGMAGSPTRVGYSAHQSTCDDDDARTAAPGK